MIFRTRKEGKKEFPWLFPANFPVYRGLDVRLLPIETKDLTVGGADLVFKAALINPNGFSFKVEKLTYKMDLAGETVSRGAPGEGSDATARGEKIFEIPLLLDFFEIGKVVYDGLDAAARGRLFPARPRLTRPGEILRSPWIKAAKSPFKRSLDQRHHSHL